MTTERPSPFDDNRKESPTDNMEALTTELMSHTDQLIEVLKNNRIPTLSRRSYTLHNLLALNPPQLPAVFRDSFDNRPEEIRIDFERYEDALRPSLTIHLRYPDDNGVDISKAGFETPEAPFTVYATVDNDMGDRYPDLEANEANTLLASLLPIRTPYYRQLKELDLQDPTTAAIVEELLANSNDHTWQYASYELEATADTQATVEVFCVDDEVDTVEIVRHLANDFAITESGDLISTQHAVSCLIQFNGPEIGVTFASTRGEHVPSQEITTSPSLIHRTISLIDELVAAHDTPDIEPFDERRF